MARIMSQESSLTRKRAALARETRLLRRLFKWEVWLAALLLSAGLGWRLWSGQAGLFWWGVVAVVCCGAHGLRVRQNAREDRIVEAGLRGETEVTRRLHEALDRTHYLFNDVRLTVGRARVQMDHLVICPRGVFVIETKNWRGRLVGEVGGDQWQQIRKPGQAPVRVSNPVRQVQRQAAMLEAALGRAGFDGVPITPFVVFLSTATTIEVDSPDVPLLYPTACVQAIAQAAGPIVLEEQRLSAIVEWLVRVTDEPQEKRS